MDDKKIDLNLLLAFEALLAEKNVTRAAARIHVSQPALSSQLNRLRDLFHDELFIPTSRGVVPTTTALELAEPLRAALDQVRSLINRAQPFDPMHAVLTLTIASSDYMQVAVLLPFLLELGARAPGVRVITRLSHDSHVVQAELEKGEVDVAFLQSGEADGGSVHAAAVLRERYIGVAKKGTIPESGVSMEFFTAARHIIVSPRAEGFAGPTDDALSALGHARTVCIAASSFIFLMEAVSRSDLIAMAPARLAAQFSDRIDTFEPPVEVPGFAMEMVWHDRTHAHPARAWLRAELAAFCARG